MQFVRNGPDIPDSLLWAHEQNRVVFFCGSGISYPAGLPSFKGLVDAIFSSLGAEKNNSESKAYKQGQFDVALNYLEQRLPDRISVREKLSESLQPDLRLPGATETHTALLQLARSHDGKLRLVTTNYDHIFEDAAKHIEQKFNSYVAPALPMPTINSWDGLVYLHGRLPLDLNENEITLHNLVITSGDFGDAYLNQQWAARFVSELFRNYVVCFVGYSVNDMVLRYMMHALATKRMLGESTPQTYAFWKCKSGQEKKRFDEWESIGITPVLYQVHSDETPHSTLHQTLRAWADIYSNGVFGKERIVIDHALMSPLTSTQQDNFAGRILWAITDRSGRPAKIFSELNPAPPLEWLKVFCEGSMQGDDVNHFDISPDAVHDTEFQSRLIGQITSLDRSKYTALNQNKLNNPMDDVIYYIASWLTRHLNDPRLIYWLLENETRLHNQLPSLIESKLDYYDRLQFEGRDKELKEIRKNSPHTVPNEVMRGFWRMMLRGRIKPLQNYYNFFGWMDKLKRNGLSTSLRMELREFLSPKIVLRKSYQWHEKFTKPSNSNNLRRNFDWDLVLGVDYARSVLQEKGGEHWRAALPNLFDDLQQLLFDALGILSELGAANDHTDGSYIDMPSIEPHWQNREHRDWVILIELLRDAWLGILNDNPVRAAQIAERWFDFPYPVFKRLAFFAAKHDGCICPTKWFEWLMSNEQWWLWSIETRREVMRLLALQGHQLSSAQTMLETAILDGPPHNMYQNNLGTERQNKIVDRLVWSCLAKLNVSGLNLGNDARSHLESLSSANPSWRLHPHESEEFGFWMDFTGDPGSEDTPQINIAPTERNELVQWLKTQSCNQRSLCYKDNWGSMCNIQPDLCISALNDLAEDGVGLKDRWQEALRVWNVKIHLEEKLWREVASLLLQMQDNTLVKITRSVASWLDATSQSVEEHAGVVLNLCQCILNLYKPSSSTTQGIKPLRRPVTEALNHPIGITTKVILNLWLRREPKDNELLSDDIKPLFTQLCKKQVESFHYGITLLASRLTILFRVDQKWTEDNLLPFFRWKDDSVEAQMVWEGFLWTPRLYLPVIKALEQEIIKTASHYEDLCEFRQSYAIFLTYLVLEQIDIDKAEKYKLAFEALPQEGLQEVVNTLAEALERSGEKREKYWVTHVLPFWKRMWPKSRDHLSGEIAASLVLMSIATGQMFPEALNCIRGWLMPIEHPHYAVKMLQESNFCSIFPNKSLFLLSSIIKNPPWRSVELAQCLIAIEQSKPDLKFDHSYQELLKYAQEI